MHVCDMDCTLRSSSVLGIFPGKKTGMGSQFLLQGIFLTQGPMSLVSPALAGRIFTTVPSGRAILRKVPCDYPWHFFSLLTGPYDARSCGQPLFSLAGMSLLVGCHS